MRRIYAVNRTKISGGVRWDVYVTGKKRRTIGKTFVIKDGDPSDAHAQVAAYELSLKVPDTS